MYTSNNDYDRGVNTFTPEGRLHQVEYAMEAIKRGTSAVGVKVNDGVALAVHRKLNSTLIEPKSIEKAAEIDDHIACAASGLFTDARTLVEYARVEAQVRTRKYFINKDFSSSNNHRFTYDEPVTVKSLTRSVSDLALHFGEGDPQSKKKPMSRPYGVSLLIGGVDENGPCLYQTDPTGTMLKYQAKGIGPGEETIQKSLENKYKPDLTIQEAEELVLSCLKETMEDTISKENVELVSVLAKKQADDKHVVFRSESYVQDIITKLPSN